MKPKRIYHRGWDKRGDIIAINGKWVTARLDGEKGVGCWEVNSPFIRILPRGKAISKKRPKFGTKKHPNLSQN